MDNLLPLLGVVAVYIVLVKLVFPRLGIRG
jgi:hypothetical protein